MKTFRAITGREDVVNIQRATRDDKAECIVPTHVLEEDAAVVGYGSVGKVALISGWTAPAVDDAESLAALRAMEDVAHTQGAEIVIVLCTEDCRFRRVMAEGGYKPGEKQVLPYFKKLKRSAEQ